MKMKWTYKPGSTLPKSNGFGWLFHSELSLSIDVGETGVVGGLLWKEIDEASLGRRG